MQLDKFSGDYKIMKEDYDNRISKLEFELSDVGNDKHSIEGLLNRGFDNLISLTKHIPKR